MSKRRGRTKKEPGGIRPAPGSPHVLLLILWREMMEQERETLCEQIALQQHSDQQ
jgi:hypothetical protein